MPRIRTIDPEVFKHPRLARLPMGARLLFIGLFSRMADDEGRFIWDPEIIATEIFPLDRDVDGDTVAEWLQMLTAAGLVMRYEADGEGYGFLPGWFEHQVIKEPQPSRLPAPPILVNSWQRVARIRRHFSKRDGQVRTNTALRLFAQCSREEQLRILDLPEGPAEDRCAPPEPEPDPGGGCARETNSGNGASQAPRNVSEPLPKDFGNTSEVVPNHCGNASETFPPRKGGGGEVEGTGREGSGREGEKPPPPLPPSSRWRRQAPEIENLDDSTHATTPPEDLTKRAVRLLCEGHPDHELTGELLVGNAGAAYPPEVIYQAALETHAKFSGQRVEWRRRAAFFMAKLPYAAERFKEARASPALKPPMLRGPLPPSSAEEWREVERSGGFFEYARRKARTGDNATRLPCGAGEGAPQPERLEVGE